MDDENNDNKIKEEEIKREDPQSEVEKQPTDELNRTMTEPKTFKEFIRWLEIYSPVDWEEMQRFEDEAGASVWIRFDLDKEEDDE